MVCLCHLLGYPGVIFFQLGWVFETQPPNNNDWLENPSWMKMMYFLLKIGILDQHFRHVSELHSLKGVSMFFQPLEQSFPVPGFDWWAYELLTLLAGGLQSETQLAAHVAATTASDWAFLVVRGAPKAATAMVGAAMGQKDINRVHQVVKAILWGLVGWKFDICFFGNHVSPHKMLGKKTWSKIWLAHTFFKWVGEKKRQTQACLHLTLVMCGALVIFCYLGRAELTHLLLPDEPVTQQIFAKLLTCVLIQLLVDGLNSCCSGVFAGLGLQGAVSIGLFAFQWVAQLPGAFMLAYYFQMGALGLHLASMVASVLNCGYNFVLMKRSLKDLRSEVPVKDYEMLSQKSAWRRKKSRNKQKKREKKAPGRWFFVGSMLVLGSAVYLFTFG